jgi:hypothetical protein
MAYTKYGGGDWVVVIVAKVSPTSASCDTVASKLTRVPGRIMGLGGSTISVADCATIILQDSN